MTRDCLCPARGNPPASFCDDDLYCPQCGAPVAWLGSQNSQPALDTGSEVLWIYPAGRQGKVAFRFRFTFDSLDSERKPQRRPLSIDTTQSRVHSLDTWFEPEFDVRTGDDLVEGAVECTLRPKPPLVTRGGTGLDWHGVRGRLELVGSCGRRELDLLIFSPPELRCEVEGAGVQPGSSGGSEPDHWVLGRRGQQRLVLRVRPWTNLLYVPPPASGHDPPKPVTATFPCTVEAPAWASSEREQGVILGRESPADFVLAFDTSDWPSDEEEGPDDKAVTVYLASRVPQPLTLTVKFRRRAQGDLQFEPAASFTLKPPVYYGERIACPHDRSTGPRLALPLPTKEVLIRNSGEHVLRIGSPEIIYQRGPDVRWLVAMLEDLGGHGRIARGEVKLDLREACRLRLLFDFGRITPENWPGGLPLEAEVRFDDLDSDRTWSLRVEVPKIGPRPPLLEPIAIDFGATNTFAAVWDNGPADGVPGGVTAVLGLPRPEQFPTALCFTDAWDRDFEIGPEAISQAAGRGDRLVRGLKRELARGVAPGRSGSRANVRGYDYRDIIKKFLSRALQECEANCRGTATRVALSYPANSSPRAIDELERVIADLEDTWRSSHPDLRASIAFDRLDADEATAVALGFALDRTHLDRSEGAIRRLLQANRNPFYVASFDFGGGSIDIALIRFTLQGDPRGVLDYESTFVGIGGDEAFGGDNVTVAVYELLQLGIVAALTPSGTSPRVTLPRADLDDSYFLTGAGPRAENTLLLWEAAEVLKRAACNPTPGPDDRERVKNVLEPLKNRLLIELEGDGAPRLQLLDEAQRNAIDLAGRSVPPFGITPEAIYNHTVLEKDFNGAFGYTVQRRLEGCVEKLKGYVERAGMPEGRAAPDVIVLAGAGCRLPRAFELLKGAFPELPMEQTAGATDAPPRGTFYVVDQEHAKSKVAFGLVRYLDLLERGRAGGLARARDYTHANLVWCEDRTHRRVWVPSCSRLGAPTLHPLPYVSLRHCWKGSRDGARIIELHRDTYGTPDLMGYFNLSEPGQPFEADPRADSPEEEIHSELPRSIPSRRPDDPDQVYLRLGETPDRAFVRVKLDGSWYGEWAMKPPDERGPARR